MKIPASDIFGCDYTDLKQVKALADRMGPGLVVVKWKDRPNYNITHAARRDRWDRPGVKALHFTKRSVK